MVNRYFTEKLYFNYIFLIISLFVIISCTDTDFNDYLRPDLDRLKTLPSSDLSFLHISDTHGSSISVYPMVEFLNNTQCDFGVITGDVLPNDLMMNYINSSRKPIFIIPGNHDAYDGLGQYGFREKVINNNATLSNIVYGDDRSNFFYCDIKKNEHIFRVIGLDQFEIDAVANGGSPDVVMSQKQIEWFIQVLENSYGLDGIIVLIHDGLGNSAKGSRDINNRTDFTSIYAYRFTNSYDHNGCFNPCLIPDIINAYKTGENIVNSEYPIGNNIEKMVVNTFFSGEHHNFIAYLGGHLHWDVTEYLSYYPNQLQVLIAFGGEGDGTPNSHCDDLYRESYGKYSYCINEYSVRLHKKEVEINRLGKDSVMNGTLRNSIKLNY